MSTIEQDFNLARQRVLAGEQLTLEEQQRLVAALRNGRNTAGEAGATSRAKKAAAKGISDDELSSDLDDLLGD